MRLRRPAIRAVKCLQGRHPTVTHSSYPSVSFSLPPLSVSLFAPASPLRRQTPCIPSKHPSPRLSIRPTPTTIARSYRENAPSLVTILRLTFARTHENSLDALAPRFSLSSSFFRGGCPSRIFVSDFFLRLSLSFSFSPRFSATSQTPRSFLASAESPPTGVTTIDYRRDWGRPGGGCARKKGGGGGAGLREDGIIAIHGSRRHNPTIRRLYNSGSVWGDAANIAFSVAFLSCVPLRLFLLFFFSTDCRGAAVDHRSTLAVLLPLANDAASWQDG